MIIYSHSPLSLENMVLFALWGLECSQERLGGTQRQMTEAYHASCSFLCQIIIPGLTEHHPDWFLNKLSIWGCFWSAWSNLPINSSSPFTSLPLGAFQAGISAKNVKNVSPRCNEWIRAHFIVHLGSIGANTCLKWVFHGFRLSLLISCGFWDFSHGFTQWKDHRGFICIAFARNYVVECIDGLQMGKP